MKQHQRKISIMNYIFAGLRKTNVIIGITLGMLIGAGFVYGLTKPYTFSSGRTISSSEVNSNFDTLYAQHTGTGAGLSTGQSITMGSGYNKIKFDTQLYGDSNYDTSKYRYTISESGLYLISYFISEPNWCNKVIYIDGTARGNTESTQTQAVPFNLTAGQYVELFIDCTSNNTTIDTYSTFVVRRIF